MVLFAFALATLAVLGGCLLMAIDAAFTVGAFAAFAGVVAFAGLYAFYGIPMGDGDGDG